MNLTTDQKAWASQGSYNTQLRRDSLLRLWAAHDVLNVIRRPTHKAWNQLQKFVRGRAAALASSSFSSEREMYFCLVKHIHQASLTGYDEMEAERALKAVKALRRAWDSVPRPARKVRRETRVLEREQAPRLLELLSPPAREFVRLALTTGLRGATIRALRPEWLVAGRLHIPAHAVKTRQPLVVAAPDGVDFAALAALPRQGVLRREFHRACLLAGVAAPLPKIHELRATWVSWAIEDGMPMEVVRILGGWSSTGMVRKHYHRTLTQEALSRAAAGLLVGSSRPVQPTGPLSASPAAMPGSPGAKAQGSA